MSSDTGGVPVEAGASTGHALRGRALRERLIASGLALIERSGAQGLSLREVARQSGVSHMAPYGFFRSKNQLLSAIAAAGFNVFREQAIRESLAAGDSPRQQIVGAMMAYVKFALARPQLLRLMVGGQIPAEDRCDELRAAHGQSFRYFTNVIAQGIADGEFRAADPTGASFAAWALVHGFTQLVLSREFEAKLGANHSDVEVSARRMIDLFMRGLDP